MRNLRVISGSANLADQACISMFMEMKKLFQENEKIGIGIPGGTSIKDFFLSIPKHSKFLSKEEWKNVHFFWVDERMVPPDNEDSNYKLGMDLFLKKLVDSKLLPRENIHRFEEVDFYEEKLKKIGLHIIILGSGPDGHVASLFPNHEFLGEGKKKILIIEDSPKPPPKRMTISPKHIVESEVNIVFFIGEKKLEAYENFLSKDKDYIECPAKFALEGDETKPCYAVTDLI